MSVNSKMTAIADSLRSLMGGTEQLGLDAMAQKGTDANAAMAAIIAAIEGKGSTVPSDTKLGGLAALIEAIQAGGGDVQIATGSFTPAEDIVIARNDFYYFSHGCGFVPDVFYFADPSSYQTVSTQIQSAFIRRVEYRQNTGYVNFEMSAVRCGSSSSGSKAGAYICNANFIDITAENFNEATIPIGNRFYTGDAKLPSTRTYKWIAIKSEEANYQ